jgi:hypothetical protein
MPPEPENPAHVHLTGAYGLLGTAREILRDRPQGEPRDRTEEAALLIAEAQTEALLGIAQLLKAEFTGINAALRALIAQVSDFEQVLADTRDDRG